MRIPASHGYLEALLRKASAPPRGAAVLCHPHPLHGGTMHTKAVFRAAQALAAVGIHALRFNFRGVGASSGSYAEGVGEREDVVTALGWLEERFPDLPLVVGGFSFGSMVGIGHAVEDPRVVALLGMGLPVRMYDFAFLDGLEKPLLVVQGEEDEFGSGEEVEKALVGLSGSIQVARIPGAGHFFHGHFDELRDLIRSYFTTGPGASVLPGLGGVSGPHAAPASAGATQGNEPGDGKGEETR